jgi:hypothetical protein
VKLRNRHREDADAKAQLAAEFGVDEVYFADDPLWYLRLTSRFRLNWRRELANVATVFGLGIALGLLFGHR